jgi:hypothetical protein
MIAKGMNEMSRLLFVLFEITSSVGVVVLIVSMAGNCASYIDAGLIALLVSAVLLIGAVIQGHESCADRSVRK